VDNNSLNTKYFKPIIHKYQATTFGFLVNAFLVETENGVILIDAALTVTSSREIRDIINIKINKPLLAILMTHGHPDHYTGAAEIVKGEDIPIFSTQQAHDQMKSRDEVEGPKMAAIFKDEYPEKRIFSNKIVNDGDKLVFDNLEFTIKNCGACESDDDSIWIIQLDGIEHIFAGDIIYNKMHCFVRDAHIHDWIAQLDNFLVRYDHTTVFHNCHGDDCGIEVLNWTKAYLQTFLVVLKSILKDKVSLNEEEITLLQEKLKSFLPNDDLIFLLTFELDQTILLLRERKII
jgi:glyoxylase-like metal-dependent hydrolase (beta-lactamase superfamily II)